MPELPLDFLMYRSYVHNREASPHVAPERWRALYIFAEEYEKIYQTRGKDESTTTTN